MGMREGSDMARLLDDQGIGLEASLLGRLRVQIAAPQVATNKESGT